MADIDLSIYKEDGSVGWYAEELARVGKEKIDAMYAALYEMADRLEAGQGIDIVKLCKNPENRRIAVKAGCEIIDTYKVRAGNRLRALRESKTTRSGADVQRTLGKQFEFNSTYTVLRRWN